MMLDRILQWLADRERQRCFKSHRAPDACRICLVCRTPREKWHRWSCNFARHVDIDELVKKNTDALLP
jgi:hypothetical protein